MSVMLSVDLLPSTVTNDALRRLLAQMPGVLRARVMTGSLGGSLGFALVEMANTRSAERLISVLDGYEWDGQGIRVSRLDRPPLELSALSNN